MVNPANRFRPGTGGGSKTRRWQNPQDNSADGAQKSAPDWKFERLKKDSIEKKKKHQSCVLVNISFAKDNQIREKKATKKMKTESRLKTICRCYA